MSNKFGVGIEFQFHTKGKSLEATTVYHATITGHQIQIVYMDSNFLTMYATLNFRWPYAFIPFIVYT